MHFAPSTQFRLVHCLPILFHVPVEAITKNQGMRLFPRPEGFGE